MSEHCPGCDGDHLPNRCDECVNSQAREAQIREALECQAIEWRKELARMEILGDLGGPREDMVRARLSECEAALSQPASSWLKREKAKVWREAAKLNCVHCGCGDRVELVEVQAGGPDFCHSFPYSGQSICVSNEAYKRAAALEAEANLDEEKGARNG